MADENLTRLPPTTKKVDQGELGRGRRRLGGRGRPVETCIEA
jgi:hypothetical protein